MNLIKQNYPGRNMLPLVGVLLINSCNHKLQTLPDGWTKISTNEKVYKNKPGFNAGLTAIIDTNSIYEECCYVQELDSSTLGLNPLKKYKQYSYRNDSYKGYYRFYGNGYCNHFIRQAGTNEMDAKDFDPKITGYRGVYYQNKKGIIKMDLFTQTSGMGSYGNLVHTIKVIGDTLLIRTKGDHDSYNVYLRKALPGDIKEINGW